MKLTKEAVKEARMKMIDTVEIWMNGFNDKLSALQKETWINATKSNSSTDMCAQFQHGRFPLVRFDNSEQILVLNDEFFDDESHSVPMIKKAYVCLYTHPDPFMDKLCQLTNLVEYLLQLEELLTPVTTFEKPSNPIKLAQTMAESIMNEWTLVETGRDTVNHYNDRQLAAEKQLALAEKNTQESTAMQLEHVNEKAQQFLQVIQSLASNLKEMFSLEKDERYCVSLMGIRVRAYIHWHEILLSLAINLYEDVKVNSQDINVLDISGDSIQCLHTAYLDTQMKPIEALEAELKDNVAVAKDKIVASRRMIKAMESQLNAEDEIGMDWKIKKFLLTTEAPTLHSFFKIFKESKAQENQSQGWLNNRQ